MNARSVRKNVLKNNQWAEAYNGPLKSKMGCKSRHDISKGWKWSVNVWASLSRSPCTFVFASLSLPTKSMSQSLLFVDSKAVGSATMFIYIIRSNNSGITSSLQNIPNFLYVLYFCLRYPQHMMESFSCLSYIHPDRRTKQNFITPIQETNIGLLLASLWSAHCTVQEHWLICYR